MVAAEPQSGQSQIRSSPTKSPAGNQTETLLDFASEEL